MHSVDSKDAAQSVLDAMKYMGAYGKNGAMVFRANRLM
jgi:hypothetical protein